MISKTLCSGMHIKFWKQCHRGLITIKVFGTYIVSYRKLTRIHLRTTKPRILNIQKISGISKSLLIGKGRIQNSSSILTLVKGFLTSLEYMATQQKIIVDLRELPDAYDECMAFVRKLEEIERWKLNFKESLIFEEKFLRLASAVGNHIAEEAEQAGIDGETASAEFKDHVNNLVKFWKDKGAPAPQSFRVSASRSAGAGA